MTSAVCFAMKEHSYKEAAPSYSDLSDETKKKIEGVVKQAFSEIIEVVVDDVLPDGSI